MNIKCLKSALCVTMIGICSNSNAQSYVTYNHDATKQNQITVQEIGAGSLTPEFYYWIFHNSYKKSASSKNKQAFRTVAGIAAYQQLDDADSIESSLKKRAEIEALNIADREVDIAWLAEGTKVTNKLSDFQRNINRIMTAGGSTSDKQRWEEYYNMFQCAVKATQDAYMPNAQRKKEYLAIYNDVTKENELLISYLVQLNSRNRTQELLAATSNKTNRNGAFATAALNRWRGASWKTVGNKNNGSGNNGNSNNGSNQDGSVVKE